MSNFISLDIKLRMDYATIINEIEYHPLNNAMDRHYALQIGLDSYTPNTLIEAITPFLYTYQNYPNVVNDIQEDIDWLNGNESM